MQLLTQSNLCRGITCSVLTLAVVGISGCATHVADKPGVHHYLGYVRVESKQASEGTTTTTTTMVGLKVDYVGANLGWQKAQTIAIPLRCQVVIVPSGPDGLAPQDKELIARLMKQPNGRTLCTPYSL